jgi:ParB-like chromosome segregation protein Spo0J
MGSTIRHNRARGTHNIELMSNIVAELDKAGMSDQWIMKNIGMDRDELLRLKQISGLAELFANSSFSIPQPKAVYTPLANDDDEVKSE